MKDIYAEIEYQCASMIDYLSALFDSEDSSSLALLHQQIETAVAAQMELRYQKTAPKPDFLSSDTVILEFQNKHQGRLYRRQLPLDYEENDNGIILAGEDIQGNPVSIAFISDTAVEKVKALTGKGWETPRCNHED